MTKKDRQLKKKIKNNQITCQTFFEIKEITDDSILTTHNEELFFIRLQPKNLAVLDDTDKNTVISQLANIIKAIPKSEIVVSDSIENYESNKQYLNELANSETNHKIKQYNIQDIAYLEKLQASMSSNRLFLLILRFNTLSATASNRHQQAYIAIQNCQENSFGAELLQKDEIKNLLSIYIQKSINAIPDYDGQQYGVIDEYDLKSYVDLVAPSIMNFKQKSYCIIGNTYRSIWAIREYPIETSNYALLAELGIKSGVTIHIYNRVLSRMEQNKVFNVASRRANVLARNTSDTTAQGQAIINQQNINEMVKKAHKEKEVFIETAVYIEMSAETIDKLNELKSEVSALLFQNSIVVDKLIMQQRDGFVASIPIGYNIFKEEFERIMPSSSSANLFPLAYSGKTDDTGFIIGKDVNGSNIIVDFDKRSSDKTNGHIGIFGNSGEGKSYLLKLIIFNFRQQQKNIYTTDIDDEYNDLTSALGGTNIDLLSGRYYINPLEVKIIKAEEENEDKTAPSAVTRATVLSRHIAYLRDFFKVYNPEIKSSQLDILEIMLNKTYADKHINDLSDFTTLQPSDYPVLSDLYSICENELKQYDDLAHKGNEMLYSKENLRELLLSINSICIGTTSIFFNGHTNIPNANHINFNMKELLSTNENLKNTMYFNVFSFLQHKFLTEGNTIVAFDEIHEILKSKTVVTHIRSFIKRGRKKNSDVIISSQNIEDLLLPDIIEYTRPFFSIPTHSFLAYPGNIDSRQFKTIANLKDAEYKVISQSHRGTFLYRCGSERYKLAVVAPPHKSDVFGEAGGK